MWLWHALFETVSVRLGMPSIPTTLTNDNGQLEPHMNSDASYVRICMDAGMVGEPSKEPPKQESLQHGKNGQQNISFF